MAQEVCQRPCPNLAFGVHCEKALAGGNVVETE